MADRLQDSGWMSWTAAVFFIVWGVAVNWEHGPAARLQVALTQGLVSGFATYFSAELIVWLAHRLKNFSAPVWWTGTAAYSLIYIGVFLAHDLTGTPDLLETMAPGLLTGIPFCFGYAWRVHRKIR